MSNQAKRSRGTNYSFEEKNCLMMLINKFKHIIENKKTDAVSNFEKEKVWRKISTEFNATSSAGIYRDQQSLKKTYLNMKMTVRKEVADEKIEIFKTGGGTLKSPYNPLRDITLQAMNQKTVFGLHSAFDSDATNDNFQTEEATTSAETYEADQECVTNDIEDCETILIQCEKDVDDETWSRWKSTNLKKPPSTPLRHTIESPADTETASYSRRRPIAASLQSSNISKLYSELAEKRLQVVELEYKIQQNKEKREQEKHDIEKKILEVQLQIKLEELRKLNPGWVSDFLNKN